MLTKSAVSAPAPASALSAPPTSPRIIRSAAQRCAASPRAAPPPPLASARQRRPRLASAASAWRPCRPAGRSRLHLTPCPCATAAAGAAAAYLLTLQNTCAYDSQLAGPCTPNHDALVHICPSQAAAAMAVTTDRDACAVELTRGAPASAPSAAASAMSRRVTDAPSVPDDMAFRAACACRGAHLVVLRESACTRDRTCRGVCKHTHLATVAGRQGLCAERLPAAPCRSARRG